ncbi:MAG: UbiA family prenyltransferase, partial [Candidatus Kapabacteria bacterium]|nr:UbiA family prenyltransferase [Candidatus Kapabacteria bacterium]
DREHPRKRKRPFASGMIPVQYGVVLVPLLLTLAFGISLWVLPLQFTAALLLYMIFTSAYSFYLKSKLIIDVLMLAGLYAFRLLAGGVVVDVFVSRWMLAFSMFMFLSLAFIKRYTELQAVLEQNKETAKGRGYTVSDNEMIRSIGPASGYMAVLVLALYINSTDVVQLYKSPSRLWLIEPMLLYWITRIWFLAHRGDVHDDPIIFALKDKRSYIVFAICAVVVVLATM